MFSPPVSTLRKPGCISEPAVCLLPWMENQINDRLAASKSSSSVPVFCYSCGLTWRVVRDQTPDGAMTHVNRDYHKDPLIRTRICRSAHICAFLASDVWAAMEKESSERSRGRPLFPPRKLFLNSLHVWRCFREMGSLAITIQCCSGSIHAEDIKSWVFLLNVPQWLEDKSSRRFFWIQ